MTPNNEPTVNSARSPKPVTPVYIPIPHITTKTIECDVVAFANWLNDIADKVNYHDLKLVELIKKVEKLTSELACLEERVNEIDNRLKVVEEKLRDLETRIQHLEEFLNGTNNIFKEINDRINWIYDHLPSGTGNIPDNWKFGMGNINVMSGNNGNPSLSIGIFTNLAIEENDVYFW